MIPGHFPGGALNADSSGGGSSGSSYAVKRYWRLWITSTFLNNYAAVAEWELRATVGGADQLSGGTITADYEFSTFVAGNAVDNNNSTFWTTGSAGGGGTHWLKWDTGAGNEIIVREMLIRVRPDTFREDPKTFAIEDSDDDVNWSTVSGYTEAAWTAGEARIFNVAENA